MVTITGHQKRGVDWDQIQNRLAIHGLSSALRTHMWAAHRLFNLPVQNDIRPSVFTRIYHGLFMAKIGWETFDKWFEIYFYDSFMIRLRKRFSPLKQLLPFR